MTINEMMDAIDKLTDAKEALERLDQLSECEVRFALVHCVRALRKVQGADMTPTTSTEVRSSYRMGCGALGMEHG